MFKQLTVNIVNKALSWRKSYHVEDLAPLDTPDHPNRTHQTPVTTLILKCIGLIIAICLLTYFFYTAAILKSNTLLTLSWVMVSLWFAATIWSDETMATSKKYELTFTVPFMYFVFYVVSFAQLAVVVWKLLLKLKPSKMHWQKISDAIQLELYSTRY